MNNENIFVFYQLSIILDCNCHYSNTISTIEIVENIIWVGIV